MTSPYLSPYISISMTAVPENAGMAVIFLQFSFVLNASDKFFEKILSVLASRMIRMSRKFCNFDGFF